MKRPKICDFNREVYDGQDYADWFRDYYKALEKYADYLESKNSHNEKIVIGNNWFKVIPDSVGLDIADKNECVAVFKYKFAAEQFAIPRWGQYCIIEETGNIHDV